MIGRQLRTNTYAISSMIIALIIIIAIALVAAGVAAVVFLGFWSPLGQIVGSRTFDAQRKEFADFTTIEVGGGFEVEIIQSASYNITITADDNMLDLIEVSSSGNRLTIGLRWGYIYQDVTLRAKITMPDLYELKL